MRLTTFRAAIAITATVLAATAVAAQQTSSSILNSIEVAELVKRAEPADHARLGAHFQAMSGRYEAEAQRHVAMARSFTGNPIRNNYGAGMSAHCKQLATLNTSSAATLRELAAYHQKLAGGVKVPPPAGGAKFEGGAGAPSPTDAELNALAARASTPAEHRSIEEYFLTLAKRHTASAADHGRHAQAYRGTRNAQAALHHDRLAELERQAAKEATAGAEMHKGLSGVGGK